MKSIGNNKGYINYSMSINAARAREEGHFPKTDFKKYYGVSERTLKVLLQCKIIYNNEWHHTSKYGNITHFLSWRDNSDLCIYKEHKNKIDSLAKKIDTLQNSLHDIERIHLNFLFNNRNIESNENKNEFTSYIKEIEYIKKEYNENISKMISIFDE